MRYLDSMTKQLAGPACAVNFWTFAVPVLVGNAAAYGAGWAAKKMFNGDHESTQQTAEFATKFGAFWVFAGLAWIYMAKRNGAKT